ncbi:hypothetical protein PR048_009944 [Dryococelus australis]|uniref:Uncharacterized protein n=1 Tax=Dryococelus australis TaxID=614101 RepID=A0ABQ9I1A4_9NEOP|nr:hypothetical protein PR048_009944 [Dryococelus australis]
MHDSPHEQGPKLSSIRWDTTRKPKRVSSIFWWSLTCFLENPQGNPTEGRNQEINKGIRMQGDHRKQDQYLPDILVNLHHCHNETLGASPSKLLLGRPLKHLKE